MSKSLKVNQIFIAVPKPPWQTTIDMKIISGIPGNHFKINILEFVILTLLISNLCSMILSLAGLEI